MRLFLRLRFGLFLSSLVLCLRMEGSAAAQPAAAQQIDGALGPNDPKGATRIVTLALLQKSVGKRKEAEALLRNALTAYEAAPQREPLAIARVEACLGELLVGAREYDEAEPLLRRAVPVLERELGSDHRLAFDSRASLAVVLLVRRKFDEAEPLLRRALALVQARPGRPGAIDPDLAPLQSALADVLRERGKQEESAHLLASALAQQSAVLGPDHPDVAQLLTNTARSFAETGQLEKAEPYARRALAIEERQGKDSPRILGALNTLAIVLMRGERYIEAEPLLWRALAIIESRESKGSGSGPRRLDVAVALCTLAALLEHQGEYKEAERHLQRSLMIAESTVGPDHVQVAKIEGQLARVVVHQGQLEQALVHYRRQLQIFDKSVRASPTEAYAAGFLSLLKRSYEAVTGLTLLRPQSKEAITLALQATLLVKSRSLEVGRLANQTLQRALRSSAQAPRYALLQSVLSERARLLDRAPAQAPGDAERIKQLLFTAQQLEQELTREAGVSSSQDLPALDKIIAPVAARLPPGSVLLEIVRGQEPVPAIGKSRALGPRYVGLLLFPDREVAALDLGPAEPEDGSLRTFLFALENRGTDIDAQARALYKQVFRPLEPVLQARGVHQLVIAPDGLLQLVPWGALHDGTQYLIDRFKIRYVSAGRDLLLAPSPLTPRPALVLADPRAPGQRRLDSARRVSITLARELSIVPLLDEKATERSLREREAPFLVLLAAHGKYRDGVLPPEVGGEGYGFAEPAPLGSPRIRPERWDSDTAMHRSALALTPGRDADTDTWQDGWLTGEEARTLRLQGTQLVTLLACESGRGAISSGQGVYGLQRALLQAGAETVVLALWSIEEQSASELVRRYLLKLLKQKKGRIEAMEEAMRELRRQPAYQHPYYWAPFIVVGMDGPLRLPAGS